MAINKVIRNALKFHLTLVGQSNPSLERNAKLRGLKAGEDLSCLIKHTQCMIAFLNCAWKWLANKLFLERVWNTECPQIPSSNKKKNSCHLFKRYSKCPQSVPNVYFWFANAGYVDFVKTFDTHSNIQQFLILLLSFFFFSEFINFS